MKLLSSAFGALALGGAAVALAGCASVSAPKTGVATHPPTSASPGPGLAGVTSAAKPTPKQRADADAKAIFAATPVPPGAHELSRAPSVGGGVLKSSAMVPVGADLVDKAGWWVVPGGTQPFLAWEKKHVPHRFSATGTGSSHGREQETEYDETFSLPAVYGVLDSRTLIVEAVADGKQTAVRVDAQVTWTPARPASEQVPAAAKAVTVSENPGQNPAGGRPLKAPKPVTITDPATVRQLIALVNSLPLTTPGEFSCPAGFGDSLTLTFRAAPGKPALAVATNELSGCPVITFTLGGKQQPALQR